jgi:hypothetical protein
MQTPFEPRDHVRMLVSHIMLLAWIAFQVVEKDD